MTGQEKLQYAIDNYSIGDKIDRKGFDCNNSITVIKKSSADKYNIPHFYNDHRDIFLGKNQIYCGVMNIWAKVLAKGQIITPQYEIY